MHPVTAEVTPRIVERSRETRREYLEHVEAARAAGSGRGKLSCANWAHAFAASPDGSERTHVFYNPSNSTILVDRSASSAIKEFGNSTVTGYFHPYTLASTKALEKITFHVIVDGSLIEIFVNERFALSTRVYPSQTCSTGYGVYVGEGGEATVESLQAWVGLKNVWPERPANSSSKLVWDTPEQTNNYTWWSGN